MLTNKALGEETGWTESRPVQLNSVAQVDRSTVLCPGRSPRDAFTSCGTFWSIAVVGYSKTRATTGR